MFRSSLSNNSKFIKFSIRKGRGKGRPDYKRSKCKLVASNEYASFAFFSESERPRLAGDKMVLHAGIVHLTMLTMFVL